MKTAGAPCTAAKLIPAYQSPSLVAPSPKVQTATWPVRRSFMLMAAPAAEGTWEAMGLATVKKLRALEPGCSGIWRPLLGSALVASIWPRSSLRGIPRARARPWSR